MSMSDDSIAYDGEQIPEEPDCDWVSADDASIAVEEHDEWMLEQKSAAAEIETAIQIEEVMQREQLRYDSNAVSEMRYSQADSDYEMYWQLVSALRDCSQIVNSAVATERHEHAGEEVEALIELCMDNSTRSDQECDAIEQQEMRAMIIAAAVPWLPYVDVDAMLIEEDITTRDALAVAAAVAAAVADQHAATEWYEHAFAAVRCLATSYASDTKHSSKRKRPAATESDTNSSATAAAVATAAAATQTPLKRARQHCVLQ
jgi:hypothetical protein